MNLTRAILYTVVLVIALIVTKIITRIFGYFIYGMGAWLCLIIVFLLLAILLEFILKK